MPLKHFSQIFIILHSAVPLTDNGVEQKAIYRNESNCRIALQEIELKNNASTVYLLFVVSSVLTM